MPKAPPLEKTKKPMKAVAKGNAKTKKQPKSAPQKSTSKSRKQTKTTSKGTGSSNVLDPECAICFEPMVCNKKDHKAVCKFKHRFHTHCINSWMARSVQNDECPMCCTKLTVKWNRYSCFA